MTGEAVMAELKQRRLPTFGTAAERRDRLRKFHGVQQNGGASNATVASGGAGYQSNSVHHNNRDSGNNNDGGHA